MRQTLIKAAQGASDYLHQHRKISAALKQGSIALTCEEVSALEFNSDYMEAKYDGKKVKFKKNGLESKMLGILAQAANSKNKLVDEEQLIGSLERATGKDDIIYKTVRNTRDRINKKLHNGLGLPEVVKMTDGKYQLEERYLRSSRK
ncbi:MAG: hypothetical protein NC218_12635 [Acetobacter sp.]|nr:hypothetical protein [Acetobacter sp.]